MKHVSELRETLSHFFDWHKSRLDCLIQILQALFRVRTVNLAEIATAFQTHAKEESAYRRVCRFFTDFAFEIAAVIPLILRLFPLENKYLLILDRTNWKWGKSSINILMLSIAYRGVSIPILWAVLDLEGNSSLDDRVSILARFVKLLGIEKVEALVADREFVGKKWFSYLTESRIPFVIRIKQNSMVDGLREGYPVPVRELCKELGSRKKIRNRPLVLWGHKLYVSVRHRKRAKEPLILASNMEFEDVFEKYRRRWEIETMFGCLKTRGFCMEDTHITDADKIERLLFVLAIAFCWAYRTGEIRAEEQPIVMKRHGRLSKSIFRVGLDQIRRTILGVRKGLRQLFLCLVGLQSRSCYA